MISIFRKDLPFPDCLHCEEIYADRISDMVSLSHVSYDIHLCKVSNDEMA